MPLRRFTVLLSWLSPESWWYRLEQHERGDSTVDPHDEAAVIDYMEAKRQRERS